MNAKNYRRNTNFQILYFLIGSCHTVDGAYALVCEQLDNVKRTVKAVEVGRIKREAKIKRLRWKALSPFKFHRLDAKAELLEFDNNEEFDSNAIQAVYEEFNFWSRCKNNLQAHRKYKHLPIAEAHEAAQQDEWRLEFIRRAENFLISTGTIPPDEFNAMRMHPEFIQAILPAIEETKKALNAERPEFLRIKNKLPQLLSGS